MDMTPREYQQYVQRKMKKSPLGKDVCLAFFVGGAICALGQAVLDGWISLGLSEEDAGTATSCTLVTLSALLTGLNLYNKLARFGGAGTLVASLASLITFREYTKHVKSQTGRFLALFSVISFGFLAILLAAMMLWERFFVTY